MPDDESPIARTSNKNKSGGTENGAQARALTFVEQKIDGWYKDQPGWLRAFAFSLFLMLFSFAFFQLFSGQYTVRGMLKEKLPNGNTQAAKGYEVRLAVDNESFGTNFRGFYYAVIGPAEYLSLMISGSTKMVVRTEKNEEFPERDVVFDRLYRRFLSLDLEPRGTGAATGGGKEAQARQRYRPFFATVLAAAPPGDRTKLVLYDSHINGRVPRADEGQFTLHLNGQSYTALSTAMKGSPAGLLPVSAGDTFQYGGDYYFALPNESTRPIVGAINLDINNGLAFGPIQLSSGYSETFPVSIDAAHFGKQSLTGSNGSRITLLNCQPYSISIFEKHDLHAIEPAIKDLLAAKGYCVIPKPPPLGSESQTNAAYFGNRLPFEKAQQILAAFVDGGVRLKHIHAGIPLSGTDDAQLGGLRACDNGPTLPDAAVKKVLTASSSPEFQLALKALPSCERTN